MQKSKFEVHVGPYILGFGMPTVVTTFSTEDGSTFDVEYFVFVEGQVDRFHGTHYGINGNNIPRDVAVFDEPTALEDALFQAKHSISAGVTEVYNRNGYPFLQREPLALEPKSKSALVRVWMSGRFSGPFARIYERTTCPQLKAYIDLLKGISVSKYTDID